MSVFLSIVIPTFFIVNYSGANALLVYKTTIFLIFFVSFFTYFFLGTPLYRHHYLALGGILIAVSLCCYNDFASLTWQVLLSCLLVNFLLSIVYVGNKYLMEFKLINPYELVFYIGCCGISIYIILFIVLYKIKCTPIMYFCESNTGDESIENVLLLLKTMSGYDYLYSFLYIIVSSFYILFCYLTNYYLSPIHYCISEMITIMLFWIINVVDEGKSNKLWYLSLVGYVLMLLSACVCNEWIIIDVWDLGKNTRVQISKRSVHESKEVYISLQPVITDEAESELR